MRLALVVLSILAAACGRHGSSVSAAASAGPPSTPSASASSASAADSIDRLVGRLSSSPLWANGMFPNVDLPETATPAEVLDQVFAKISFDRGKAKRHAILTTRVVRIGKDPRDYTAALVDTDLGRKIALLQWQAGVGWWSRVFDEDERW